MGVLVNKHKQDDAGKTNAKDSSNPMALITVSNGMWAVKLCSNKILQLLTDQSGGAG